MSEIKHEHRILEAIDQLRRRKARPDVDRICSYLQRRFAVSPADAISDLQRLVDADIVVKVEYKGNTSYRNAAKWSRYAMYSKSREENHGVNQSLSSLVSSGIAELIVQEPDYLDFGVPRPELKRFLYEKDRTVFSESHFDIIVQREVCSGNIVILENGNYSLADHPVPSSPSVINSNGNELKMLKLESPGSSDHHSEDDYVSKEEIESNYNATYYVKSEKKDDRKKFCGSSPDTECSPKGVQSSGFRVGVRRKRAKKVFDPSDNNIPTRKRGRPVGSTNAKLINQNKCVIGGACYLCQHHARNRRGQNEKLISCRDCSHKVHPSCANLSELASSANWLCSQCKTCVVCSRTSESGGMVVCSSCDQGYHFTCHSPPLLPLLYAKWFCKSCSAAFLKIKAAPGRYDIKRMSKCGPPLATSSAGGAGCHAPRDTPNVPDQATTDATRDVATETRAIDTIKAKVCSNINSSSSSSNSSHNNNNNNNDDKDNKTDEGSILGGIKLDDDVEIDNRVPDASCWTTEQVYKYLSEQGFPEEAAVLRHHGIDGPSLLLMKRDDVLIELSLKLGPALKLYKQVKKLQIRRCEDYYFWP